jgi:replicative DNA helicase
LISVAALRPEAGTLPHSVEAEQQLLGACLMNADHIQTVMSAGGAELFYDQVHAAIFHVAAKMDRRGKHISPVTVTANLPEDIVEAMRDIGGKGYLARCAGFAAVPSAVSHLSDLLQDYNAKRQIIGVMRAAQSGLSQGDLTASDIAAQMEAGISALSRKSSAVKPISMMAAVTEAMGQINNAFNGEVGSAVLTGIKAVDSILSGFSAGELSLIGGRPSMGKTAVALSVALNAARAGHHVVIASLEMTPASMAMRALSEQTGHQRNAVAYSNLRRGEFTEKQGESVKAAAEAVATLPVSFLPRQYQDVDLLQAGAKQVLRDIPRNKMPLIIVDYAQLLKSKANTRYEQITDISLALKGMAMDLEVPVIALSQLSRNLESREDKRPMLSDLRESGQLEQDADSVIFCYRDEYYAAREEPNGQDFEKYEKWQARMADCKNKLELIVAKQRQGQIGVANVSFNPSINLIWEPGQ